MGPSVVAGKPSGGFAQDLLEVVSKAVTVMLQQFREHGDGSHAGEGIDFVQQDLAIFRQEEVDARQVGQFQLTERLEGILVDCIFLRLGQAFGLEAGRRVAGAAVLLFIGVELVLRHADLARIGGNELVTVLVDSYFQLARLDRFFDQHLLGVTEGILDPLHQVGFVAGGVAAHGRALGSGLDKHLAPLGQGGFCLGQGGVVLFGQEQIGGVGNADGGEPQLGADLVEADLARLGIATEIRQARQLEEGLQIAGLTRVAVDAGHHVVHRTGHAVKREQLVQPQLALAAVGREPAVGKHLDPGHFDAGHQTELLLKEIGAAQRNFVLGAAAAAQQQDMHVLH